MIKSKAYLISDSITKEKLTGTLNKIYNDLKNYSGFKNYSSPTVISIALYTSKDRALNMPESWIAMLTKTPTNSQPEISFDDFKLEAQSIDKNERKTDSDTLYEKTVKYFSARKIDLCYIHKTLNDLELKTIRQADAKYPNFGDDHLEYQKKLYKKKNITFLRNIESMTLCHFMF
jgi:signal recognition particle subunit SEC65